MTVSSEVNRAGPYLGNGSTTVFGFGFRILSASHLRVIITDEDGVETDLPYPSGYSVTGVGANAGGSITISPAPVTGSSITILRNVPMVQETDLENQGAYYAETVERQFDLIVMQNQQQSEELRRAVKVPAGDPDPDGALSSALAMGILRLYESAGNIDTVAGQADAIDTVASTIVQVQTVATEIAAVLAVSGSIGEVRTVADDIANVRTVAGVSDDVAVVAANLGTLSGAAGSFLSMVPATLNGDGTTTEFSIPAPSTTANVIVWVNKVRQTPGDDYEVNSSTLTFVTAPAAGAEIELLIVTAVSLQAVQDLYDEFTEGLTIQKRNIITTAGQRRYAVDAAGAALSLRSATSAVFGSSPFGMLTLGVDYTIDDGALLLSFDPADGELFHVIAFPRVSNSAAQVILQDFEDRVAADALLATGAAASNAARSIYGGTSNAITITGGFTALTAGLRIRFRATAANNGSGVTLNLDGLGARPCVTVTGVALPAQYIRTNADTEATYDGANWVVSRAIERGANANGEFVRFEDGTQICAITFSDYTSPNQASGSSYVSPEGPPWTFPAAFISAPRVLASARSSAAIWVNSRPLSPTQATARLFCTSSISSLVIVDFTANGRWY